MLPPVLCSPSTLGSPPPSSIVSISVNLFVFFTGKIRSPSLACQRKRAQQLYPSDPWETLGRPKMDWQVFAEVIRSCSTFVLNGGRGDL